MTEAEKQRLLKNMTAEEREKFMKGQKEYEEKKAQDQYMDRMME